MTSQQRIALITGGNRGIGRSTALALAAKGVDSVITYRSHADECDAVLGELEALGRKDVALQLDTSDTSGFEAFSATLAGALQETWGPDTFDYLVNNAGNSSDSSFTEVTEEEFDGLIDVHFKGVFFLTQRLLDQIADNGSIVNISTGLARFSFPKRIAYGSVKGAVEGLARDPALGLGPPG